jgi:hypothetical protein
VLELRGLGFAATAAALLAVLVLVGLRPTPSPTAPTPQGPASQVDAPPRPKPPPAGAWTQARRFVSAFLSFEVGAGGARTDAAIRAGAWPDFARRLLSDPPTAPAGAKPRSAHLTSLRVDPVPGHPDLALASGDAHRPEGAEPFSFLFARREGRWLAVAPGE